MKKGRGKRYSASERSSVLAEYKGSGLGMTQWCKENGYNKSTLGIWLAKQRQQEQASEASISRFISMELEAPQEPAGIEIHYPNGVFVRLAGASDSSILKRLISIQIDV